MSNALPGNPRIALIHYWYVERRGGERVFEALADLFPNADLFTMVLDRKVLPETLRERTIHTSFLQKVPGIRKHYPKLLSLYPLALEQLRLDSYDLVISHESGPTKGVLTRSGACHICYSHSPMRYLWEMYHRYRDEAPGGPLARV
ncbi:MAG: glycosyltransferase family 4 protein, partial [Terriglobia bacterium]